MIFQRPDAGRGSRRPLAVRRMISIERRAKVGSDAPPVSALLWSTTAERAGPCRRGNRSAARGTVIRVVANYAVLGNSARAWSYVCEIQILQDKAFPECWVCLPRFYVDMIEMFAL